MVSPEFCRMDFDSLPNLEHCREVRSTVQSPCQSVRTCACGTVIVDAPTTADALIWFYLESFRNALISSNQGEMSVFKIAFKNRSSRAGVFKSRRKPTCCTNRPRTVFENFSSIVTFEAFSADLSLFSMIVSDFDLI